MIKTLIYIDKFIIKLVFFNELKESTGRLR